MADDTDKTEEATPKKREDARNKGQVAQSRDVSTVLLLASAVAALSSPLGGRLARFIYEAAQKLWGGLLIRPESLADYHALLLHHGALIAIALAPFALIFAVVGAASNLAQIGWLFSAEALAFKPEKMNPVTGFKTKATLEACCLDFPK